MTTAYGNGLARVLRFRWIALLIFIIIGGVALSVQSTVGSVLPKVGDGRIMVKLKIPQEPLSARRPVLAKVETALDCRK